MINQLILIDALDNASYRRHNKRYTMKYIMFNREAIERVSKRYCIAYELYLIMRALRKFARFGFSVKDVNSQ